MMFWLASFFQTRVRVGRRLHVEQLRTTGGDRLTWDTEQWGLDGDDTESLQAQLYTPFMQLL
jgi:hypothetical protein